MTPESFVRSLASLRHENVFNPYSDTCPVHDLKGGAAARRRNLRSYLTACDAVGVDTIWMGRDLGYRGGRRTGLALTDEVHLAAMSKYYPKGIYQRATRGPVVAERTAAEIWSILQGLKKPPLLWNVFPLHPHEPEEPFSNRRFSSSELRDAEALNAELIGWLGIKRIVAIGQDAARYASKFTTRVVTVRHPSYGGVSEFRAGMREIYSLPSPSKAHLTQRAFAYQ